MERSHFMFYQNKECEFYPCHKMDEPSRFSCLFCYCPLFWFCEDRKVNGCKDCTFPHDVAMYPVMMKSLKRWYEETSIKKEKKMSFSTWFMGLFNKLIAAFKAFIKDAFDQATQLAIGEFSAFALSVVTTLASTDLTSEAKRLEAFKKIKDEAIARGKALSDSVINLLIELAYSKYKATHPTA